MISLNYPSYPFKLRKTQGQDEIFDPFRKRWLNSVIEDRSRKPTHQNELNWGGT